MQNKLHFQLDFGNIYFSIHKYCKQIKELTNHYKAGF